MIHVYLKDGIVADIARVNPFSIFHPDYAAQFIPAPDEVTHGWLYADGVFSEPAPPPPAPPVVPAVASMRQARLALLQAGKLADVDAAIAAMPSPAKDAAQIEWEYATEVRRDSALMQQLATAIGLSDGDLDNLFTTAAGL